MKKVTTIVLAIILMLALSVPAFASSRYANVKSYTSLNLEQAVYDEITVEKDGIAIVPNGITVALDDAYLKLDGELRIEGCLTGTVSDDTYTIAGSITSGNFVIADGGSVCLTFGDKYKNTPAVIANRLKGNSNYTIYTYGSTINILSNNPPINGAGSTFNNTDTIIICAAAVVLVAIIASTTIILKKKKEETKAEEIKE